ncbi:MAG: ABC transporter permease [Geminicoccaceae bacterium]|nr:ABC transporter permease [Geminicoccaceae bacterium]MDW8123940.1 ABC transporter permease [Geminicoccaceae bacterium]
MSRFAALAVGLLVLLPTLAGLCGTLLPAFGLLPVLGFTEPSLEPWRRLFAAPGTGRALVLALLSGLGSTLLALLLSLAIAASTHGRAGEARLRALLPFLLALPHAAYAVAFAFLFAPSGLLVRLLAPALGLSRPPDLPTVNDPWAFSLTLALALRETPFLLFVLWAAADRAGLEHRLAAARCLGRDRVRAWLEIALPALWPSLRLPLLAVLAYGLSAVDMALVLGPTAPPVFSVLVLRWFTDPDLDRRLEASAGALLLVALAALAALCGRGLEAACIRLSRGRPWPVALARVADVAGRFAAVLLPALGLASGVVLLLWSLAGSWRFPAPWPAGFDLAGWRWAGATLPGPLLTTVALAAGCAIGALLLVVGLLERPRGGGRWVALLWLPLLLPPIGFVFGLQLVWILLGLDERPWLALLWAHLLFVLPYLRLVLAGPWAGFDPRLRAAARSLGARPRAVLARIVLPVLARPVLAALAVGVSVSAAQYLATLAATGGRVATLATETLALFAGGDRRRVAVAALVLAAVPLAAASAALFLPVPAERARRGGRR